MTKVATKDFQSGSRPAGKPKGGAKGLKLVDGAKVAVVGGGPAGAFFSYFLLNMAESMDLDLQVDVYEAKRFSVPGPAGCNMCGGVVSESLVQMLATEGINLPTSVVVRGIDAYVLHTDAGVVRIKTPLDEMRIAAVYRGAGPRGVQQQEWHSFDGFLLELAAQKGAQAINERVEGLVWKDGLPQVITRGGTSRSYDLLVGAAGVNSPTLKLFEGLSPNYRAPEAVRTYISEFFLGREVMEKYLAHSMHVFLLNLPRLEFAALIPKGDYVTFCLLGKDINDELVKNFFQAKEVQQCMPPDWRLPEHFCHCSPRIGVSCAAQPYADRLVLIGDCGTSRLYKDGIGSAYRTAKAAARTVIFEGVSRGDFERHFRPLCQAIRHDNWVGELVFAFTRQIQRHHFARVGMTRMIAGEQKEPSRQPRMSMVLWDTFTGSASYGNVFLRTLHPLFWGRLIWETFSGLFFRKPK